LCPHELQNLADATLITAPQPPQNFSDETGLGADTEVPQLTQNLALGFKGSWQEVHFSVLEEDECECECDGVDSLVAEVAGEEDGFETVEGSFLTEAETDIVDDTTGDGLVTSASALIGVAVCEGEGDDTDEDP